MANKVSKKAQISVELKVAEVCLDCDFFLTFTSWVGGGGGGGGRAVCVRACAHACMCDRARDSSRHLETWKRGRLQDLGANVQMLVCSRGFRPFTMMEKVAATAQIASEGCTTPFSQKFDAFR